VNSHRFQFGAAERFFNRETDFPPDVNCPCIFIHLTIGPANDASYKNGVSRAKSLTNSGRSHTGARKRVRSSPENERGQKKGKVEEQTSKTTEVHKRPPCFNRRLKMWFPSTTQ
jgi:hypothetical protein